MESVRRFVRGAKLSAAALLITTTVMVCVYGTSPIYPVGRLLRSLVVLVWSWNAICFLVCGGLVLWGWLVDRYGDRPKDHGGDVR